MKKFVCLLSVASILMFVFMVFIEDVKAEHYVPKVELESMITRLETCRQEYINAQWNSARLSAISLKEEPNPLMMWKKSWSSLKPRGRL